MSSRFESEMRLDVKINERLEHMPKYVELWNLNLKASRRTATTRFEYVKKIYHFLCYIKPKAPVAVSANEITEDITINYFISIQTKEKDGERMRTSDSYQLTTWACLNSFMDFMVDRGYMKKNFMKQIKKPRDRDLERINKNRIQLTTKDFKKIYDATERCSAGYPWKQRDQAILLIFMNTGMRESALKNMELRDIDLENRKLTVIDKEEKLHTYIINDAMYHAIEEWEMARTFAFSDKPLRTQQLFVSREGTPMSVSAISRVVEKYTEIGIGKRLSPHKLRAGVATILYNKTNDLEMVRRAIGHSSISTTQRYVVTKGEEREKMSQIMENIFD